MVTTDDGEDPFRNGPQGSDPSGPPPPASAGDGDEPVDYEDLPPLTFDDASIPEDPSTDPGGGDPGTNPPAPMGPRPPGDALALCTIDAGCKDGLVCYDSAPGFCTQPCDEENTECAEQMGHAMACDVEAEACQPRCGDGAECPAGYSCSGTVFSENRHCLPDFVEGSGDRQALEPCDLLHGDSDCLLGLVCYRWNDTRVDGPGYCTPPCSNSGECQLPAEGEVELDCGSEGACRFHCTDAPCPPFLECEEVAGMGGRCHYPPGTPY